MGVVPGFTSLLNKREGTIPKPEDAIPKRQDPPVKKSKIYIPLPSKPRCYVAGSGPPLQPIQLLPPHDSTAYIKDRVLLPPTGLAANGKALPRRMTYLVGWHDLPAATLLVPAMEILNYVSPYMLEDWESKLEQELDDERRKLDKLEAEERQEPVTTPTKTTTTTALATPQKRRRGRPPVHSKIEAAVVAESETVAKAKSQPKKGVMSLSTPQKKSLREFEELLDDDDDDDDDERYYDEAEEADYYEDERQGAGEPTPSQQIEMEAMDSAGVYETTEVEMAGVEPDSRPGPVPPDMKSEDVKPASEPSRSWTWASYGGRGGSNSANNKIRWLPPNQTKRHGSGKDIRLAGLNQISPSPFGVFATTPLPSAPQNARPLPAPSAPAARPQGVSVQPGLPSTATPAAGSTVKAGTKRARSEEGIKPARPAKAAATSRPAAAPAKAAPTQGDDGWVVKRLEDVQYYEDEDRGIVRYFKVRWEGDWPADQNPTWEPEENIPPTLVRNFMKMSRQRKKSLVALTRLKGAKPGELERLRAGQGLKQGTLSWPAAHRYNSVAEAFLGDQDSGTGSGAGEGGYDDVMVDGQQDVGEEQDEFFVVAEEEGGSSHGVLA